MFSNRLFQPSRYHRHVNCETALHICLWQHVNTVDINADTDADDIATDTQDDSHSSSLQVGRYNTLHIYAHITHVIYAHIIGPALLTTEWMCPCYADADTVCPQADGDVELSNFDESYFELSNFKQSYYRTRVRSLAMLVTH